jgi:hypothetical protein
MHQQRWGYKVEDKLYMGVHEQKRLNTTGVGDKGSGDTTTADVLTLLEAFF